MLEFAAILDHLFEEDTGDFGVSVVGFAAQAPEVLITLAALPALVAKGCQSDEGRESRGEVGEDDFVRTIRFERIGGEKRLNSSVNGDELPCVIIDGAGEGASVTSGLTQRHWQRELGAPSFLLLRGRSVFHARRNVLLTHCYSQRVGQHTAAGKSWSLHSAWDLVSGGYLADKRCVLGG